MIGFGGISPEYERKILRAYLVETYHWTFDYVDQVLRERPMLIRELFAFKAAKSKRNA
jgi:hypothetical protein